MQPSHQVQGHQQPASLQLPASHWERSRGLANNPSLCPEIDTTLQQLCANANHLWKDTNSLLLIHLLKYDWHLADYLADTGKTIQAQIWAYTQAVANAIGMSLHAHLGLVLDMLEHLPTTLAGLSFTSGILLLMANSPEALAYQGEGMESNNFQLIENSTAAAVLNQNLQQLLTMPHLPQLSRVWMLPTLPRPALHCLTPKRSSPIQPGGCALGQIS